MTKLTSMIALSHLSRTRVLPSSSSCHPVAYWITSEACQDSWPHSTRAPSPLWKRMFYESNESMSQIWKNKSFGRNNKIKHYFYLICLLASLLPAHARPISDMKSQLGLYVSSIPGPAATTTCMPRKIAFPDTLQEPFKPSDNPYY